MFLVTGVPGKTGSATAEALLKRGQKVAVLARSQEKAARLRASGAEVIVGSLDDVTTLTEALRGKEAAFLMIPPNYKSEDVIADRKRISDGYAEAVRNSGIPHVVLLSSFGAEHARGTGLIQTTHNGEEALRTVARNVTFLRASYFLENWSSAADPAKQHGVVPSFLAAGRKVPQIATADIGEFAAEALIQSANGQQISYITGPNYTPEEIAAAFGEVLGKPIQLQSIPDSQVAATLMQYGSPKSVADNFQEMTQSINSGLVAIPDGVHPRVGKTTAADVISQFFAKQSGAVG